MFVCSSAGLRKNYLTDFHQTRWKSVAWPHLEPITFWSQSESRAGSTTRFLVLGLLAGLCKNYHTDFHETWWNSVAWPQLEPITFWRRSESRGGSTSRPNTPPIHRHSFLGPGLCKNYQTDFHETRWKGVAWPQLQPIKFWSRSESRAGSTTRFLVLGLLAGLYKNY